MAKELINHASGNIHKKETKDKVQRAWGLDQCIPTAVTGKLLHEASGPPTLCVFSSFSSVTLITSPLINRSNIVSPGVLKAALVYLINETPTCSSMSNWGISWATALVICSVSLLGRQSCGNKALTYWNLEAITRPNNAQNWIGFRHPAAVLQRITWCGSFHSFSDSGVRDEQLLCR